MNYDLQEGLELLELSLEDDVEGLGSLGFDFALARTRPNDRERIGALRASGFDFLDRRELAVVPVAIFEQRLRRLPVELDVGAPISDDIFMLASEAFPTDHRFHLGGPEDALVAPLLLRSYIEHHGTRGTILRCHLRGRLAGFVILRQRAEKTWENVLGAVDPKLQSTGVALSMYTVMVELLKERDANDLNGWISTENLQSLNLHLALGARFKDVEDTYVLRREQSTSR